MVDQDAVAEVALTLQEPNIELVSRVVQNMGRDESLRLMREAQSLDAQPGGVLVADGSRRKTPGGIFLSLVKQASPPRTLPASTSPPASKKLPLA